MEYHLSIAGERSGPHSQFHVIEGIREGRFQGGELVWRLGLPDWQPLREVPDFEGFWPVTEEQRASAEAAMKLARAALDRPQPWMRFWARVVDNLWFLLVLGMLLRPFLPDDPKELLTNPLLQNLPLDALALLLYVPVEAWLLSRFGTTPGRSLLRVQVRRLDGGVLGFRQALRRSFQVYVMGLALGLPLVYLFAMAWWRMKLLQKGVTAWDESNETRVEHGETETWRQLVLVGVIIGVALTLILVLSQLSQEMISLPG